MMLPRKIVVSPRQMFLLLLLLLTCVFFSSLLTHSKNHTSQNSVQTVKTGICINKKSAYAMKTLYSNFTVDVPWFLNTSLESFKRMQLFDPPFGFRGQLSRLRHILYKTKEYAISSLLTNLKCKRCVVVGNGGTLINKQIGKIIDGYDIVIRLNSGPVKGFEKNVGSKTTLRITYPEGAMQQPELYDKDSLFVLSAFKWQDLEWLKAIIFKKQNMVSGYWKSVPHSIPKKASQFRVLNPYFFEEAAFVLLGLPFNHGKVGNGNVPTLGVCAVVMALHGCDEVAIAGFGYDLEMPNIPLHYYETIPMKAIQNSWTHNIHKEKQFLKMLVKQSVIVDLTNNV